MRSVRRASLGSGCDLSQPRCVRRPGRQGAPRWAAHAWGGGCPGAAPNNGFHLTAAPVELAAPHVESGAAAGEPYRYAAR